MSNRKDCLAAQRISRLLDENSFVELGSLVTARSTDFNLSQTQTPSDGVITGHGLIDGSLVFVYSQDVSVLNGTIGEMHAKKIASVYDMAMKMGAPVIGFLDCAGIRLQESVDALDGFGQIYAKQAQASGVIPQICAVFGTCGGGLSVVPALCDFAFVEKDGGKVFVNSPNAIERNRTEKCDTSAAEFQSSETGIVDGIGTEDEIFAKIRSLVSILPENNQADVYTGECTDDLNRACESMENMRGDARYLLAEISDGHVFFETKEDYAKDMVTGFKACKCAEKRLAKAMGRLTYAFANATVPKVNLITGDVFGSASVIMNAKSIGADLVYAWPDVKVGMMDAKLAAGIMYEGESADVIEKKAKEYDALQDSVLSAAKRGYVDLVVEPQDTRKYVVAAFEMLYTKRMDGPFKKHGTK